MCMGQDLHNLLKKKKRIYATAKTTTISKIKKALTHSTSWSWSQTRAHTSLASLLLTAPHFLHSLLLLSLITVYILILILLLCHYSLFISLKAMNPSEDFVEQGISQQVCIFSCPLSY